MKQREILLRRERLARELPSATEIVRGSLLERTIGHSRGCPKCARGEGHPVSVLTVGYAQAVDRLIADSLMNPFIERTSSHIFADA